MTHEYLLHISYWLPVLLIVSKPTAISGGRILVVNLFEKFEYFLFAVGSRAAVFAQSVPARREAGRERYTAPRPGPEHPSQLSKYQPTFLSQIRHRPVQPSLQLYNYCN